MTQQTINVFANLLKQVHIDPFSDDYETLQSQIKQAADELKEEQTKLFTVAETPTPKRKTK